MIYDLDDCLINQRVYDSWMNYIPIAIIDLQEKIKDLKSSEIPDEQLREFPDGSAEIFVNIRGKKLSMKIKKGEWRRK